MTSRARFLTVLAALWLAGLPPVLAGTVSLSWSSAAGATGYRVYYGTSSRSYTGSVDVGNATTATVTGLANCTNWYLAVKAYNSSAESTEYSNEIVGWPRPEVTSVTSGMQGAQYTMRILGANFRTGVVVETDPSDEGVLSLTNPRAVSCSEIQVAVAIEPMAGGVQPASVGLHTLMIENPDTVFAETQKFEVLINPARFDVNTGDETTLERLDGKDTAWISRLHGLRVGDPAFDPDGDLDGDGWIDGEDLAYIAGNFGLCWSGSAWNLAACPSEMR